MLCRYESRRIEIVEKYNITPIAHVKLLTGQEKKSCTNDKLEDKYYCFSYVHKKNKNDSGTFDCGKYAAEHFLKLLNHEGIPLFNPLSSEGTSHVGGASNTDETRDKREWNAVAKELSNAMNLLIICWNVSGNLNGALRDVKKKIEANPDKEPSPANIKSINTVIGGRGEEKRKLSDIVGKLRKDNPTLREYSFDLINDILDKQNIPSNFI
ncbi:hypothetical protein CON11_26360 [Priestia megaterium]|uniref:hypothetical protein n=1 Tax=Priestia megaterium TaxID=1404 RepID=UPI000BEBB2D8|nr:hypothetical protein [Priestia megaterium]PEC41852.1 hypothetical protein CON11_26360 [Priestia megaterium]